jgi:hypothetical protein
MHKYRSLFTVVVLIAAMLACANPLGGTGPAQPANVETVVAATLQALTAPAVQPVATLPPDNESLLPHSIYFLNNDNTGLVQVYRLARDGKTLTQVTFEPVNVESYDISLVDGSVVYATNNQLFTVNADGSNRSMIVDGGPIDPNNPYVNQISTPLWSADGQSITYGHHGISIYSIVDGQSTLAYENQLTTDNGFTLGEINTPISYSPDGSKLLINIVPLASDGGAMGILTLGNKALVRLTGGNHRICCSLQWAGDNNTLYGAYAAFNPFVSPGLWRVDAASGAVTDLIPAFSQNNTVLNFASEPFPSPDGQLYFFYATQPYAQQDEISRVPLQLVRSAADGVTNRTILSADIFNTLNETLWAPDASFVITASGPIADVYQGGIVELYYTDGQRAMISLLPFAFDLKWGP